MKTAKKHEHARAEHKEPKEHAEHEKQEPKLKASDKKVPGGNYPLISGIIIVILLTLVIILLLRKPAVAPGTGGGTATSYTGEKAKVEFYVMSQCPYGTQVENAIAPVLESMGEAIDFHLDYIVSEDTSGQFQSLHGAKEVAGDIVQLCAMSYYPEDYKYMKFILCQNKDAANVDTNWEACAKENSMDVEKLRKCLNSDEGKNLLRTSMQKAQLRNAGGSPTMYVDDAPYQSQRDALSFQRAICKVVEHEACKSLPKCASDADCTEQQGKEGTCNNPGKPEATCTYTEPVKVDYVMLTASDCKGDACDTTNIMQVTQQLFLGAKARNVDVSSEEGKALIEKYKIEVVPAYIFDKSIEQTKSWINQPDLKTAFELVGDKYKILDEATGATHFVNEETRKDYYAAIGVVTGDNKPQIDFFVMSYCPYGNQAEEGIEPAYQLLKDKAIFKPHYVIYENYGGGGSDYCLADGTLCSMHGIQELNQDVREACVNKYMGIAKWFEFALAMNKDCTSQNADSCWEPVANKLGFDIAKIKKCQADEAVTLMKADKELGDKLKVSGSPTIFIDGQSYSGGRTPEAYKQGLCAAFETQPTECSTQLAGAETTTTTATGGCG